MTATTIYTFIIDGITKNYNSERIAKAQRTRQAKAKGINPDTIAITATAETEEKAEESTTATEETTASLWKLSASAVHKVLTQNSRQDGNEIHRKMILDQYGDNIIFDIMGGSRKEYGEELEEVQEKTNRTITAYTKDIKAKKAERRQAEKARDNATDSKGRQREEKVLARITAELEKLENARAKEENKLTEIKHEISEADKDENKRTYSNTADMTQQGILFIIKYLQFNKYTKIAEIKNFRLFYKRLCRHIRNYQDKQKTTGSYTEYHSTKTDILFNDADLKAYSKNPDSVNKTTATQIQAYNNYIASCKNTTTTTATTTETGETIITTTETAITKNGISYGHNKNGYYKKYHYYTCNPYQYIEHYSTEDEDGNRVNKVELKEICTPFTMENAFDYEAFCDTIKAVNLTARESEFIKNLLIAFRYASPSESVTALQSKAITETKKTYEIKSDKDFIYNCFTKFRKHYTKRYKDTAPQEEKTTAHRNRAIYKKAKAEYSHKATEKEVLSQLIDTAKYNAQHGTGHRTDPLKWTETAEEKQYTSVIKWVDIDRSQLHSVPQETATSTAEDERKAVEYYRRRTAEMLETEERHKEEKAKRRHIKSYIQYQGIMDGIRADKKNRKTATETTATITKRNADGTNSLIVSTPKNETHSGRTAQDMQSESRQ